MITVGISTKHKDDNYISHIKKTIGVKHVEILCYENNRQYSLTEVYNMVLENAKYDVCILIHDDLVFKKKGWGNAILSFFNNSEYGILGLAGTTELDETAIWWNKKEYMCGTVYHQNTDRFGREYEYKNEYSASSPKTIQDVVLIDGLFIALHKQRIKIKFNEEVQGFHFYDVTFCLSNFQSGVRIGVVNHPNIQILHKSVGRVNDEWHRNKDWVLEHYRKLIPSKITPNNIFKEKKILLKKQPKLAIIIPTKNNIDYLRNCVYSIYTNTLYENFQIFIADTGSDESILNEIKDLVTTYENITLLEYDYYNFAKINNDVVFNHIDNSYELLLFCNDDIELINDSISIMVRKYLENKRKVGTIGARLLFENNKVQHGGVALYFIKNKNQITTGHLGYKSSYGAEYKSLKVFGNTAAFMLIKHNLFKKNNGFPETQEFIEDVLLNLECLKLDKTNYMMGDATCYHYESISRKKNEDKQQKELSDLMTHFLPAIKENLNLVKEYIIPV